MGGVPASKRARGRRGAEGVELDVEDHPAPAQERTHGVEQLGAAPEDPETGRAHRLVRRVGQEVDAEGADVHRCVRHELRAVGDHDRPGAVRHLGHLRQRRDGAEHVGHGRDADQLDPVDQRVEVVEHQAAAVVDRDVADVESAELLRDDHPRHDVGVVLHLGQEDGVARPQVGPAPAVRHQVERLGRVLGEHHLVRRVRRADEAPRHQPGPLVERGGLLGRRVDAAVDVGVRRLVVVRHGVDDRPRLERGGGGVEIHDRPAVDGARQQGEVLAQGLDVERRRRRARGGGGGRHRHASKPSASTRRASSGPPLATMRPSTRRWTTSGTSSSSRRW